MLYVAVHEVEKFEGQGAFLHECFRTTWFQNLSTREQSEIALARHAVMARYRDVAAVSDLPRVALGAESFHLYFGLRTRMMQATFLRGVWLSPAVRLEAPARPEPMPSTVLCIDDALRVIAASGDEQGSWGPFWAAVEARDAAAEDWFGCKVPLALQADDHERTLHVLWREGDVLAAADTDPARWDAQWDRVQNWMVTKQGPRLSMSSPSAWSDLRVRPLGPARARQRHIGAVTA